LEHRHGANRRTIKNLGFARFVKTGNRIFVNREPFSLAVLTFLLAGDEAHQIKDGLWTNHYAWLVEIGAVIATIAALHALWLRRYLRARIAAAAQVTLIPLGWGIANCSV
jgi:hypothetical protein